MYDLVISGGDSFTFGAELDTTAPHIPSPHSWANLVAQRIGKQHINTARSGRSNSFIVRQVIHEVIEAEDRGIDSSNIFVQVMWTFTNRHEFALAIEHDQWDSPWFGINPYTAEDESESDWFKRVDPNSRHYDMTRESLRRSYKRNLKNGIVDFAKNFVKTIQSTSLYDSYISANAVLQLQDFFSLRQIPYLFTYVDGYVLNGIFTDAAHNPGSKYLNSLRKRIAIDNWYRFPQCQGFLDWARENDYKFATSHPLESAHRDAADLVYQHLINCGVVNET